MWSGPRFSAFGRDAVPETCRFSKPATIKKIAMGAFALSLLFVPATSYAQDVASQPPPLQQQSLLNLNKQLKAPHSPVIKAACPSYSACCCVIGGYSVCTTTSECAALGGGCTGRC